MGKWKCEKIFTVEEVSDMLKLPETTIRKYLRNEDLKGAKIGKSWRIPDYCLQEFIDEKIEKSS